jgi:hypothetical protein
VKKLKRSKKRKKIMTVDEILAGRDIKIHSQQLEDAAIDSVFQHPQNPRRGDVGAIAESVVANGFYGAIVVQASTRYILAGNHRWLVAKKANAPTIPALIVDVDDDTALKILLADNRTAQLGSFDDETLAELLSTARDSSQGSLSGTGYDEFEFEGLLIGSAAKRAARSSTEVEQSIDAMTAPTSQYNLVFADDAEQERWFVFLRKLKADYPELPTASARVLRFLTDRGGLE